MDSNRQPQPRQYGTGIVNIVGVNNMSGARNPVPTGLQPQATPPEFREPQRPDYPQLPDITGDKFKGLQQDSETRYNAVLESMKAQSNIRQAALQAKGAPSRHLELAGIFDSIANAGLKYLEYEKEKQAAKDDMERQRNSMMARAALEEITINAQSNIRRYGQEHGINTTREDARRVLEYYSQILPPEEMAPLYTFYGTELRELESGLTTRYFESAQEQKEAQISLVKSQLTYEVSGILGAMSNPQQSQQQTDQLFNQAYDYLLRSTTDLDPVARMQILSDVLTPFSGAATTTASQRTAIEQRQADLAWFIPYVEQNIRPQWGDDPLNFKYQLWAAAPESIRPLLNDIPNNTQLMQELANRFGAQSSIQSHQDEQRMRAIREQGLQPTDIAMGLELAHRMIKGDASALAQLSLINSKPEGERLPAEHMALQYYEQWQSNSDELETLHSQLSNVEEELAKTVRSFPVQGAPETVNWIDQATGRAYQIVVEDANGNPVPATQVTPEQLDAAKAEVAAVNAERQRIQNQIQRLLQTSTSSGFDVLNPSNRTFLDAIQSDLNNQANIQTYGGYQAPNDPSGNPQFGTHTQANSPPLPGQSVSPSQWRANPPQDLSGFNWSADQAPPGYASGQSPVAPLARANGHVIPFTHTRTGQITVSSPYGDRVHPVYGDVRFHSGTDFAGESLYNEDVGAVTPAGGHVLAAWDWNGFGGTVMVQTPTGHIEQYSHLRSFLVRPGDTLRPGEPVGVIGGGSGDRMPGSSTGRHLHMNVWKPGTTQYTNPEGDTIDPIVYLQQLPTFETAQRGTGSPAVQHPGARGYMPSPDATPDGRGNWLGSINAQQFPYLAAFLDSGGGRQAIQAVPIEQVYNNSNPMPGQHMSTTSQDYPQGNNPNNNYGYDTIANDSGFARALADVATEIGIPAVWLADLLYVESNHDPAAEGPSTWLGRGYGMIQTMSGGVLAEWGISPAEVQSMNREQQVRQLVRRYLMPWKGQLNSVMDLVNVVRSGTKNPGGSTSDGYTTNMTYLQRMGAAVGRRYGAGGGDLRAELGTTHTSFHQGCTTCQQQTNRYGAVIPHNP